MKYSEAIRNTIVTAMDKLETKEKELEEWRNTTTKYHSEAAINANINQLTDECYQIKHKAQAEVNRLLGEGKRAIVEKYAPKGADVTPDAALLNSGMKFTQIELEEIYDKYPDNPTMQRIIFDYVSKNHMPFTRAYYSIENRLFELENYAGAAVKTLYSSAMVYAIWFNLSIPAAIADI